MPIKMKKKISLAKQGRLNREAGARFELKVRKELEANGWITDKWTKNVDLETNELIPAKRKFNPFNKVMTIGTGFPDFIAFKSILDHKVDDFHAHKVIAVESKSNGQLDKKEKEKCQYLLDNNIFKEILIAKKGEKKGSIEYINFLTKEPVSIF